MRAVSAVVWVARGRIRDRRTMSGVRQCYQNAQALALDLISQMLVE